MTPANPTPPPAQTVADLPTAPKIFPLSFHNGSVHFYLATADGEYLLKSIGDSSLTKRMVEEVRQAANNHTRLTLENAALREAVEGSLKALFAAVSTAKTTAMTVRQIAAQAEFIPVADKNLADAEARLAAARSALASAAQ